MKYVIIEKDLEELSKIVATKLLEAIEFLGIKKDYVPIEDRNLLLTVKQAAELLHVTPTTIHIWKARGKISFLKIGRRTLFLKDDLYKSLTVVKKSSSEVTTVTTSQNEII